MSPPLVARILVGAAAPRADYESLLGDLHEEFVERTRTMGRAHADLWYWSQVLRSIPPLLSYTRAPRSIAGSVGTTCLAVAVVFVMLVTVDAIDAAIGAARGASDLRFSFYFVLDWACAIVFGAVLASFVREHPVRLALVASVGLVVAVAAVIALGFSTLAEKTSSAAVVREQRSYGNMPTIVLTTTKDIFQLPIPKDQQARLAREWFAWHDEIAALSSCGVNYLVKDSTLSIPIERPERVVAAIRAVVTQSKGRSTNAICRSHLRRTLHATGIRR